MEHDIEAHMDARDDATEIVNEWTLPSVQRTSVLVDLIAEALAARDRRIAELESLAERQAAAHDDTLDRAEAAEGRAARAEGLLRECDRPLVELIDGGCDHDVGICACDLIDLRGRVNAFLATSAETEEE